MQMRAGSIHRLVVASSASFVQSASRPVRPSRLTGRGVVDSDATSAHCRVKPRREAAGVEAARDARRLSMVASARRRGRGRNDGWEDGGDDDGDMGAQVQRQLTSQRQRNARRDAKEEAGKRRGAKQRPARASRAPPAATPLEGPTVVWLRQDLRIHDNPALHAAARSGEPAVCLYVWSEHEEGTAAEWGPGGASKVFLHHSLAALDKELRALGGPNGGIVFRKGPCLQAVLEVVAAVGAKNVVWNRRYEPRQVQVDRQVEEGLRAAGLHVMTTNGTLLYEPHTVQIDMRQWRGHFGTLTPFTSACQQAERVAPLGEPLPATVPQAAAAKVVQACAGVPLDALGLRLMPLDANGHPIDWAQGITNGWRFGEHAALELLEALLARTPEHYEKNRHLADGSGVSRLSPYLHFGVLSARRMHRALMGVDCMKRSKTLGRRLAWRDLAYWQLHHWPSMPHTPIRPHYAAQPWAPQWKALLPAWQQGKTGYPLVDAAMRELWATGWQQQSVRMAAANFLTEACGAPWMEGAAWFHDTLVDADLAINSMMWQNAGMAGMDPWSFSISPVSRHQDPSADYVRAWVPELARLPTKFVHEPWKAPAAVLEEAGVVLGVTYPCRVVTDLAAAKTRAAASVHAARSAADQKCVDKDGYDVIDVPSGALAPGGRTDVIRVYTTNSIRAQSKDAVQSR